MCGVLLHKRKNLTEDEFLRNLKKLSHRGPDGSSYKKFKDLFIGHTRLSIIDLSDNGLQPMISRCNNFVLSFNGEIYNYKDLKSDLKSKGHNFVSKTDSEVVLNGFVEYGNKIFKKLQGIFSIIIYDIHQDKIVIARDSFGVKPLYYFIDKDQIIISSETKVFYDYCKKDEKSKILFLSHGYIPFPRTNLENVLSSSPGCFSEIKDQKIITETFFDLTKSFKKSKSKKFEKKYLFDAVQNQLMSDAKIGCFLSGGIDSSILSFISNSIRKDIETYSINFDQFNDEKKYQQQIITRYEIKNKELILKFKDFNNNLNDFLKKMDIPTIDGFNTFFVSKLAKNNNAKVVFSGIGSDEIFYGYSTFKNLSILKFLRNLIHFIPLKILKNKFKKLDYLKLRSDYGIYLSKRGVFSITEISKILNIERKLVEKYLNEFIESKSQNLKSLNLVDKMGYYEISNYMEGQLLKDSDVFGMANSIEIRVPFLDDLLVDHVIGIDSNLKINSRQNKTILIEPFKNDIPESIYFRKKSGFELPYRDWLVKKGIKKTILDRHKKLKFLNKAHWSKIWALHILDIKY